ncbi:MAG TPA: class D sortase [Gaiellaceae bacterium]|jgi:LPXTG-site transpeptidase (sortase) family protein|nr:class D sortase [Gaiellaceae bacterium]
MRSTPALEGATDSGPVSMPAGARSAGVAARWYRRLGRLLMLAGALTLVWVVIVWKWEDPFTAVYTLYEQHELSASYDDRAASFLKEHPGVAIATAPVGPNLRAHTGAAATTALPSGKPSAAAKAARNRAIIAAEKLEIRKDAATYRADSQEGQPLGRITVHRLGLSMIFLNGTDESSLAKGPGRDVETYMPGQNRLVYIAGHRTTFLAPFSHIEKLRRGDKIKLELPYATFVYEVTRHIIVTSTDLAVLRSGSKEMLALQACHPRFFATHRYIVYARPVEVIPRIEPGLPYRLT